LEAQCIQCQHCLAVCPTAAVSILGRNPDASLPLTPDSLPAPDTVIRLVRGRRSVRRYRDANVDPALVTTLLSALANAPSAVNRRELTFTVIDDKDVMQRFRERLLAGLRTAAAANAIPDRLAYVARAVPAWFEQHVDIILRGAPHVLIVSAPPEAPAPREDLALALAYFELMAQNCGLGTVWCGMLKIALEALPELKPVLGLPADHHYYTMLFGLPAVKYARTVQRDDSAKVRRVTL
jgi:nitroreductase